MATSVTLKPNAIDISGSTSGTTTLQASAVAGTTTLTLPAATDTLVGKATTDTLTNKTLTGAAMNGTLGATTPSTASVTTLTTSSTVTHSGGTANGVAYLDGSKVLTTGSALVFDGSNLGLSVTPSWDSSTSASAIQFRSNAGSISGSSGYMNIGQNWYQASSANRYLVSSLPATLYEQNNGTHKWYNAPSGTAGNAITFTQAMTLDASGNLGVGTTTTTYRMNVYNNINGTPFTWGNASRSGYLYQDASGIGITDGANTAFTNGVYMATASNYVGLYTNGSERARIDSSGNLLVGTTSSTAYQTGNNFVFNTGSAGAYEIVNHTNSASGSVYIGFGYNGSGIGSITQNGTTGVLYNLTSDYRLKNDQQALTGAKDFIMALKPKKWQWWDGSGEGVGFVAHEFMEVAKYSGNGEKDAVDTDGNPVYQSIQPSSSEVMANLVSFIQEQQAIITQLQADVAALKGA